MWTTNKLSNNCNMISNLIMPLKVRSAEFRYRKDYADIQGCILSAWYGTPCSV